MQFVETELYGGAITARIPAGLLDASQLRQIPDTQEVFLNPSTNTTDYSQLNKDDSLTVDLLERVDVGSKADSECVRLHLAEIAHLNGVGEDEFTIVESESLALANFKGDHAYLAVALEPAKKWGRTDSAGPVLAVALGIIRIKRTDTDLLVTVNVPVSDPAEKEGLATLGKEESKAQQRIGVAKQVVAQALQSLEIKHWELFG